MFIVLDKIDGEERIQCLINTDHIVSIDPVVNDHKRHGYTAITTVAAFDGYNDVIYTDYKVGHVKAMMVDFVDMAEISDFNGLSECECGHNADEHGSMGTCLMCKCDMFEDKVG